MAQISAAAVQLMIGAEIGSDAEYATGEARPTWPGDASGVTIGIGYDLGYVTPARVHADWDGLLPGATVTRLAQVAGMTGAKAQAAVAALQDITVPLAAAQQVFTTRTLAQLPGQVRTAFPGADGLPDDAFGALASVIFNRGAEISETDPRRIEMWQIRDALAEGRPRDIPAYLRAMKRLWPAGTGEDGLRTRRDAEASLFAQAFAPTA
jgi:GH24 family phage-related lysozyme (muramidase)